MSVNLKKHHATIIQLSIITILLFLCLAFGIIGAWVISILKTLPNSDFEDLKLSIAETSIIVDKEGNFVDEVDPSVFSENIRLNQVPSHVQNAFLAIEDQSFYRHHGLDLRQIAASMLTNIKSGHITRGASTITHQKESLAELKALVEASDGIVVLEMTQQVRSYHPRTMMGKGKLEELKIAVDAFSADLVIFDQVLSGVQMREIEKILDVSVLDRTGLILDIFARRARTDVGKLQVYLAQLEYAKSHLIGRKNYSRLGGGIGTRGPGEQKLEIDRRRINDDIHRVRKKLIRAKHVRDTGRRKRTRSVSPSIAIVGYTNAGKSSLMNRILKELESPGKMVYVQDMPFASLDPDTRKIIFPDGLSAYITDTVGFISNLPTTLIEAFQTTLEELKESDLIIHVIDGSGDDTKLRYETTRKLLVDLGIKDTPIILFVNKADLMAHKKLDFQPEEDVVLYGSVKHDATFDYFYRCMQEELESRYIKVELLFSYDEMAIVEGIKQNYPIEAFSYEETGVCLVAKLPESKIARYKDKIRRQYV